jgi:hypothetical protein
MSKIDRRTMIGVAGASIALSACAPSKEGGGGANGAARNDGINDRWGDNPHDEAPAGKSRGDFNPAALCVVYIRFDADNKATVRHGYIDTGRKPSGESDQQWNDRQVKAAEKLIAEAATAKEWANNGEGYDRREVNFERFNFGQQMRIFAVVDNDGIGFDDRKIDGRFANLVRFAKYQTKNDGPKFDPKPTNPNNAFFGATLVKLNVGGKARDALRLDNWYLGPNGKPIDPKDPKTFQYFAMDLHLLWQTAQPGQKVRTIPIVIDPDGGNMGDKP